MTPESVARIVERRAEREFVDSLRAADAGFEDQNFEAAIADVLRTEPELVERWAAWGADQRWTPSAYIEGREVGWFDSERQHVRIHPTESDAVADFIHRMAAWLARRVVVAGDS
jgi:hypothetical protein